MQTIVHAIRIDSDNHGYTATQDKPALVMGQATDYVINLIDETGQPFEPQNIEGVNEWRFVLAGDFDQGTPNCLTPSARYSGQGWFHANVSESWTAEMVRYLGGAAYKPIQAEIIGIGAGGETKSDWVFQFETFIRNRVDAIGHSAPSAITPYMTSADLIAATVDYLDPILSGVESVSARVNDIYADLEHPDNGLAAITEIAWTTSEDVASINGLVDDIDGRTKTLATSAQATAIQSALNDSTNGLESIRNSAYAAFTQAGLARNEVSDSTFGNRAIKSKVDTLATSAQAANIYQYLDGMIYGNVSNAATYARQAFETAETLATSGQFDTLMRAVYSDYSQLESGHTAIIESGTFGLVQLTNKVAAVQSAIGDIQTALAAITGVS